MVSVLVPQAQQELETEGLKGEFDRTQATQTLETTLDKLLDHLEEKDQVQDPEQQAAGVQRARDPTRGSPSLAPKQPGKPGPAPCPLPWWLLHVPPPPSSYFILVMTFSSQIDSHKETNWICWWFKFLWLISLPSAAIYLFICSFIWKGTAYIVKKSANAPELAERLIFINSLPLPDVKGHPYLKFFFKISLSRSLWFFFLYVALSLVFFYIQ